MIEKKDLIQERSKVYSPLSGYLQTSAPGLVYFYDFEVSSISKSVQRYVEKTLEAYYGKAFDLRNQEQLELHLGEMLGLPNVTPNGTILPKKETAAFLDEVQQSVLSLLGKINVIRHVDKMMCPHIMIKTPRNNLPERPYYTGEIHSDAWVGHHGDAIFMCGVLGDIDGTTVEYFEPIEPSHDFLHKSENFKEAQSRFKDKKYIGKMSTGKFVAMDHCCLHRTKNIKNSGTRISLNFGVIMKSDHSHAVSTQKIQRFEASYFRPKDLSKVGTSLTFAIDETLQQCEQKYLLSDAPVSEPVSSEPFLARRTSNVEK